VLFSIGWVFLACNEYANKHPSPWQKRPYYITRLKAIALTGSICRESISPYQDLQASIAYEEESARKQKWMAKERELLKSNTSKMNAELSEMGKGEEFNRIIDIRTPKRESILMTFLAPLKRVLYPIQKQLRQIVLWLRILSSVLMWEESYFAFWITTASFLGSIAIFKVPFGFLLRWILRALAWVVLGPWMM